MKLEDNIKNSFNFNIPKSKKTAYVILVDGQRVKLSSGKYVWNGIGAAKSALTNHLYYSYRTFGREDVDNWVAQHITFIPLSQYEADMVRLQKTFDGNE